MTGSRAPARAPYGSPTRGGGSSRRSPEASDLFIRVHGVDAASVGLLVGGGAALGGRLGVTLGGVLADRWRRRYANGRLRVGMLAAAASLPLAVALLSTRNVVWAFALNLPTTALAAMWVGPAASTVRAA